MTYILSWKKLQTCQHDALHSIQLLSRRLIRTWKAWILSKDAAAASGPRSPCTALFSVAPERTARSSSTLLRQDVQSYRATDRDESRGWSTMSLQVWWNIVGPQRHRRCPTTCATRPYKVNDKPPCSRFATYSTHKTRARHARSLLKGHR